MEILCKIIVNSKLDPLIFFACFSLFIFSFSAMIIKIIFNNDNTQESFWDFFLPIIVLVTPYMLVLTMNFDHLTKLYYLISVKLFIIIPIMILWSKNRKSVPYNDFNMYAWSHPLFYKHVSIALLYPTIWGIYFSLVRYQRLGNTIDVLPIKQDFLLDFVILIPFIALHLIPWIILIFSPINLFRNWLWCSLIIVLRSFHLKFLEYSYYFTFLESIFKFTYIVGNYIRLNAPINLYKPIKKYAIFRQILHYLYFYPMIFTIILLTFILIEILITEKLYYGLYYLFFFPIILSILRCFNEFHSYNFVIDVCLVDYLKCNYNEPHYPMLLWILVQNPEIWFGIEIDVLEEDYNIYYLKIKAMREKYNRHNFNFRRANLLLRTLGMKDYDQPYQNYTRKAYCIRIKAAYRNSYGVRWFHSTRILKYPLSTIPSISQKMHPIVLHLCKDPYQFLALMDSNIPFNLIEKAFNFNKFKIINSEFFSNNNCIHIKENPKNFTEFIENIQAYAFSPLTDKKVNVGNIKIMRSKFVDKEFPSMQTNPDVGLYFKGSTYSFQESIGIDFKYLLGKTAFSGRNQVSVCDIDTFVINLDLVDSILEKKHGLRLTGVFKKINELAKQGEWENQLEYWADNLSQFPKRCAPPLYMPKNLPRNSLKREAQEKIIKEKRILIAMSKKAYENNIPEDHFNESHIQQMLSEESTITLPLPIDPSLTVD